MTQSYALATLPLPDQVSTTAASGRLIAAECSKLGNGDVAPLALASALPALEIISITSIHAPS